MAEPITPEQLYESHRWIHLDELAALPGNPNQGDEASLAASVDAFGWVDGIVIHRGVVIAGNHRVDLARANGENGLPGYDLSAFDIDEAHRMAMALTLNRVGRSGVDDPELLAAALGVVGDAAAGPALPPPLAVPLPLSSAPSAETTTQARDGFVGSATRQLILAYGVPEHSELGALVDDLLAPGETLPVLVARLLGVQP